MVWARANARRKTGNIGATVWPRPIATTMYVYPILYRFWYGRASPCLMGREKKKPFIRFSSLFFFSVISSAATD